MGPKPCWDRSREQHFYYLVLFWFDLFLLSLFLIIYLIIHRTHFNGNILSGNVNVAIILALFAFDEGISGKDVLSSRNCRDNLLKTICSQVL